MMNDALQEYLSQFDLSIIRSAEAQMGLKGPEEEPRLLGLEELIQQAESFPLMFFILDAEARLVYANKMFLAYAGLPLESISNTRWLGHVHPEDRELTAERVKSAIKGRQPFFMENRFKGADGLYRSYIVVCAPRIMSDGSLYYLGISQDITGGLKDYTHEDERKLQQLTGRELEVLQQIAQGLTNNQIAERLIISEVTVKNHVGNIFRKLGVTNRTQAAYFAQKTKVV